jgi:hypothetical protein
MQPRANHTALAATRETEVGVIQMIRLIGIVLNPPP